MYSGYVPSMGAQKCLEFANANGIKYIWMIAWL